MDKHNQAQQAKLSQCCPGEAPDNEWLAVHTGTSGVVVIAATNRIAALESALRRPRAL